MWEVWPTRRFRPALALPIAQRAWLALTVFILALTGTASAQSGKRYVPHLGLSVLSPTKVAFHPGGDLFLIVNDDGRIDLINISVPSRLLKIFEIFADARDAAFSPEGDGIVSSGADGTVRLWGAA